MARYRKVDVRIWGDADFRAFSDAGKTLFLYFVTAPESTSVPGLYPVSKNAVADALGWGIKKFQKAFDEVSMNGKVQADWDARVVWVRNASKYNIPESPNVVRSWRAHLDEVPECNLKAIAIAELGRFVATLSEAYRKAFLEALPEGLPEGFMEALPEGLPEGSPKPLGKSRARACVPDQDQEQDQEQEQERGKGAAAAPEPAGAGPAPAGLSRDVQSGDSEPEKEPSSKDLAGLVWSTFREARKQDYPGRYTSQGGDSDAVKAIAERLASDLEAHGAAGIDAAREWLDGLWAAYFGTSGKGGALRDLGHPMRAVPKGINGYHGPESWEQRGQQLVPDDITPEQRERERVEREEVHARVKRQNAEAAERAKQQRMKAKASGGKADGR